MIQSVSFSNYKYLGTEFSKFVSNDHLVPSPCGNLLLYFISAIRQKISTLTKNTVLLKMQTFFSSRPVENY